MGIESSFRSQVPLAPYTSMHVGGPARFLHEPEEASQVLESLSWARQNGCAFFVLGRGTNLVVSDSGFDGLVLHIGEHMKGLQREGCRITALAGTSLDQMVLEAITHGLAGMERLAGIPGGVGGAVTMNAGAFEQSIDQCLTRVFGVGPGGPFSRQRNEIEFGYRQSPFQNSGEIVLKAEFEFVPGDPRLLQAAARDTLERRQAKQPWDQHSAGSAFKRPAGHFAGALIEKAGLKGFRIGDAAVSEKHAGFVVNLGHASAAEVREVILRVRDEVERSSGVRLEPEVIFVGRF